MYGLLILVKISEAVYLLRCDLCVDFPPRKISCDRCLQMKSEIVQMDCCLVGVKRKEKKHP